MNDELFRKKCRCIEFDFKEWLYIPKGKKISEIETCVLEKDEVEALRLVDGCHNTQAQAAECMNISSSTIQRILERAREKLIRAIVRGHALQIKGGNYTIKQEDDMPRGDGTGPEGKGCGTGRGLGKKAGKIEGGQGKGIPRGGAGKGVVAGQGRGRKRQRNDSDNQ